MSIKRLQLALRPFTERPLFCNEVSSLQLVRSRFGLRSVDPRAPQGAAEAQSRSADDGRWTLDSVAIAYRTVGREVTGDGS